MTGKIVPMPVETSVPVKAASPGLCALAVGLALSLVPLAVQAAPASDTAGSATVPMPSLDLIPDSLPTGPEPVRDDREFGTLTGAGQYRRCLGLLESDPDDAYDLAQTWAEQGGGPPALHCAAMALIELGHEAEGARRLEILTQDPKAGEVPLRVQILGQAGNAWLLADNPGRALAAFTSGIRLGAGDPDADTLTLRYDRARTRAILDEWPAVAQDLTAVLERRPQDLSARVLRARARRLVGNGEGAAEDIKAALALSPQDPASLIERGQQRAARGDEAGARSDWVAAALGGEGTVLAETAQALLEALDFEAGTAVVDAETPGKAAEPAPVTAVSLIGRPALKNDPQGDRPAPERALAADDPGPAAADGLPLVANTRLSGQRPRRATDILRDEGFLLRAPLDPEPSTGDRDARANSDDFDDKPPQSFGRVAQLPLKTRASGSAGPGVDATARFALANASDEAAFAVQAAAPPRPLPRPPGTRPAIANPALEPLKFRLTPSSGRR